MSRPKTEINPIPGQRLKKILDEQGISQSKLADRINLSQQTISQIIRGTATLTQQTAELIIALYPQYRLSWLLGIDDLKTGTESLQDFFQSQQDITTSLWNGLLSFSKLSGFNIQYTDPQDAYTRSVRGYTISRDGKSAHLSIGDMNALQNDICDFVEFKLQQVINKQNTSPEVHKWRRDENGNIIQDQ